ncbi:hypothetical protein FRC02_001282 [Tulasnella sp. 418]|nr:hypothetical protein FRC02_001282 [Tulasnella sp. 418]
MQTGNTDNSDASGFTYVTRPSKRKAKNKARTGVPALSLASLLNESRNQLHETKHWQDCVAYVDDLPDEPLIHKALCLGLGSPTASVNAREQLLLFMELLKHFHIDSHAVTVYDPVFSEEDRKGLKELGFEISEENKKGRYPVDERTLVYMPHCGKRLYENLYRANWSKIQLSSLVLVGNDLQGYEEGTPKAKFEAQTPCLARILPYLQARNPI